MKTQSKLLLSLISAVAFAYAAPEAQTVKADDVFFAFDSAKISKHENKELKAIAEKLNADTTITVRIEGNGDKVGTEAENKVIAMRRAEAVKNELVEYGVAADRISIVDNGKDHMKYAEQKLNRRADVFLTMVPAEAPVAETPVATTAAVVAQPEVAQNNWYADANVGIVTGMVSLGNTTNATASTSAMFGPAVNLNFGKKINQYVGIEAGFTYADLSGGQIVGATNMGTNDHSNSLNNLFALNVAARGDLPLSDKFGLFGKAGLAYAAMSYEQGADANATNHNGIGLLVGGGAQYKVTNKLALQVQDTLIAVPQAGYPNILTLGAKYDF